MSALVAESSQVVDIAAAIRAAPLVSFDLEFLTADRLVPTLCLVQVGWLGLPHLDVPPAQIVATEPEVRLLDALAVDVRPVVEALAAHPLAIAHAARQDLGILAAQFGVAMPNLLDTQVMAAFAGVGDQIGLANLAAELLGVALGKDSQWTDWARRPLSEAQLAYAIADVRHLHAIYAKLAHRLGHRVAWARAESRAVAGDAVAAASITAETAWKNVGGLRGLDARALAAVQQLAAWRYRTALELDRPLGWVLSDKSILDLARQRPGMADGVRGVKGLSHVARQRAEELARALAAAQPEEAVPIAAGRAPSPRAQRWSELLMAIAQVAADQSGVAVRLLATRADAEEFARTVDERGLEAARELPAIASWRREVLGELWVGFLEGRLALVGNPSAALGFQLVPRD